jgi:pimeloyl-ACP methyl ester carboxylesterase
MQPLIEHSMKVGNARTRVLELEGDRPPFVLFHGYADSADTWRYLLDRLARQGQAAIAVDLPGFGRATKLGPGSVLQQLDRFGARLIETVAPDGGATLVGNSLGGCLAMRLAERQELGVGSCVAVAPAGLDMARWFVMLERDPVVRAMLNLPVPMAPILLREAVARVYRFLAFSPQTEIDPKVPRMFASHFRNRATLARYHATAQRLLPELRDPFDLGKIRCPLLLVWGTRDRLVFQTGAQRVLDTVPGSELEVIEDCGHCPQLECPDRFAELVLDFAAPQARAA